MKHEYITRTKKDSAVKSESFQNLEGNVIKNVNSAKDEIINLKEAVMKRLQENNENLRHKC